MSDQPTQDFEPRDGASARAPSASVESLVEKFRADWQSSSDGAPKIEEYLGAIREPELSELVRELVAVDVEFRILSGDEPAVSDYQQRFPDHVRSISDAFTRIVTPSVQGLSGPTRPAAPTTDKSTHLEEGRGVSPPVEPRTRCPAKIGRYVVHETIGEGGFGRVYRAYDEQLQRSVAIKVPHPHRMEDQDLESYLVEARVVAGLDHPGIVPVYDVGKLDSTETGCYVVSKFILGDDLRSVVSSAPSFSTSAQLTMTVAESLHYAHTRRLVHRDVKPANILIDGEGNAHLADFGLALKEENRGIRSGIAGTPAYMSPEQARGEGHLVDGRSDIFSLGAVFYELLTGERPFKGLTSTEVIEQIRSAEPRPPRQLDDTVPAELERICLKALAKKIPDRYTTARDMADDLRHWIAHEDQMSDARMSTSRRASTGPIQGRAERGAVIPKGLRAFDEHDGDFFLQLVPGPTDRNGLPECIRFWKHRLEAQDADTTFRAGLLYGPSGCGKSSLLRAGILPRLSEAVIPIVVDASRAGTEQRLLNSMRKACPWLDPSLDLPNSCLSIRRQVSEKSKKVVVVIDQFEQWLHANRLNEECELIRALRQTDGGRLQTLLLVRDDFWIAVSHFMNSLDCQLVQGSNIGLVDLFDTSHAAKVLADFGRAYDRLPRHAELTDQQIAFIDSAISELTVDGRIVPVQLAILSEMLSGTTWAPDQFKKMGGARGVGVSFLEQTFSARTANPTHRLHEKAVRAVLGELLPESGTDIKDRARPRSRLLQVSGYAQRPDAFEQLLEILDRQTRLLTPIDTDDGEVPVTELEDFNTNISESTAANTPLPSFQLTHDYLVPAIRTWLGQKQQQTWRGRAQLRLTERTSIWNTDPRTRYLPTIWEYVPMWLGTQKASWTLPQRRMMRAAFYHHAVRASALVALLLLAAPDVPAPRERGAPRLGLLGLNPLRAEDRSASRVQRLGGIGRLGALTAPVPWEAVEPKAPERGQRSYRWTELDDAFLTWQLAGLEPVLCLTSRSAWASTPPEATAWIQAVTLAGGEGARAVALREFRGATPPRSDQWHAWGRLVREIVERYDGDGTQDMPGLLRPLRGIQILHRADDPAQWMGSTLQYLRLLHVAHTAAKEAHPEIQVVSTLVDVGGLGHAPDPDRRTWQERVRAQQPRAPISAVLEARRAQDLLEHLVDLPRLFDVLPQRGSGHLDDDESNLRFLRRRLNEAGATDAALWLVGGPTTKTGEARTPTARSAGRRERNVRRLWRSAARNPRHGQHQEARAWLARGQSFDLVRTALRARAAGADAVYMAHAFDLDGTMDHGEGTPASLCPGAPAAATQAPARGPLWYALRQLNEIVDGARQVRLRRALGAGHLAILTYPRPRPWSWTAVLLADPSHAWAGEPGQPDARRRAELTLPTGKYRLRGVAQSERGAWEREATARTRSLQIDAGPEPVFILPDRVRENPD